MKAAALGLFAVFGLATGASAADIPDAVLKTLTDCQAIPAVAERAACYDAAVSALTKAVKSGDVIVVERKEAEKARRGAFGFTLPGLDIFDRVDRKDGDKPRQLESITGEAARTSQDGLGRWVIELTDGAVWRQIDNEVISPSPKRGAAVEIRRAALGSFMMRINGQRGVRARRSE